MFIGELFKHWTYQVFAPGALLRSKYNAFKELLEYDARCLEGVADLEEIAYGREKADWARMSRLTRQLTRDVGEMVRRLKLMGPSRYVGLPDYYNKFRFYVSMGMDMPDPAIVPPHVIDLEEAADLPRLAGGKAHNVGLMVAETYLRVPPGFVVTANAFNYFLEANGLRPELDELLGQIELSKPGEVERLCREMRELVLSGLVPPPIAEEIRSRALALAGPEGSLAVRSSAVAEDGELTFAGQYESLLPVDPEQCVEAYRQVLAGKYTPRAVTYRILNGLSDVETPMAVLVMPLVEAQSAGVVYTLDMDRSQAVCGMLSVYAVPGVGENLVGGKAVPQIYCLTRDKEPLLVQEPGENAVLTAAQAEEVAHAALELELMFGSPQDVEWAFDHQGQLHILQSRPLGGSHKAVSAPERSVPGHIVPLLSDAVRASGGAAHGRVFHYRPPQHGVQDIPRDAVLVVGALDPALAGAVGKIRAVVAEAGSRASHFASVAREFGLPVLVGVENAFERFGQGREITVDADTGTVYPGRVEELLSPEPAAQRGSQSRTSPALDRLSQVMPHISRLTLTDPQSPDFTPEKCRSLHDIVRFCHEMAVAEMFFLVGKGGRGMSSSRKLETGLPLVMYLLDVGGGLFTQALDKEAITPDDIKSPPMWSLWQGLSAKDVKWLDGLTHMDWEEFDRISAGIFSHDSRLLASYAVISEDYTHLMIRFGYHFSQVDTLCSPDSRTNYINFRFKGGGGSTRQRELRLRFMERVFGHHGWKVRVRGDLLDATLGGDREAVMQKQLFLLGRILGRTRLMDMGLRDEAQVDRMAEDFLHTPVEVEY
ncbi:MAG: PEP/pyruvate-binding domain-containing protein [Desulfovibrionaceae bacterium]